MNNQELNDFLNETFTCECCGLDFDQSEKYIPDDDYCPECQHEQDKFNNTEGKGN